MTNVFSLSRKRACATPEPAPVRLRAPWGADVFLVRYGTLAQPLWVVFDESRSGGSAGSHGEYVDRAEAVREGRKLAEEINGTFHEKGVA